MAQARSESQNPGAIDYSLWAKAEAESEEKQHINRLIGFGAKGNRKQFGHMRHFPSQTALHPARSGFILA